jgi:uracil-DNA glycosylase
MFLPFCGKTLNGWRLMVKNVERELKFIHQRLKECRKCPNVCDQAVHGPAIATPIMIVGQAPGVHEGTLGRPFAYTAGKTLFKWLHQATGSGENEIREIIYFSAVARCFPGKSPSGSGDRPPSPQEIENCSEHLAAEVQALQPKLILAVGKSAIAEVLKEQGFSMTSKLNDVVGKKYRTRFHGALVDVIPLPHPSGVSRWPQTEPGKTKLAEALKLLSAEFKKMDFD